MPVTYDFSGRTAIVTGGSRGIGRAIAGQLVESGANVWVWDIEPAELAGARTLTVDVARREDIASTLAAMKVDAVDILVNDAGYLGSYRPFEQFDPAEWQRIVSVNLLGMFEVTHQVLPLMRRRGSGRIVNLGSLAGKEGLPGLAAYSAASAGVIAFTKALSREICDTDIRINLRGSRDRYPHDPRSRQRGRRRHDHREPAAAAGRSAGGRRSCVVALLGGGSVQYRGGLRHVGRPRAILIYIRSFRIFRFNQEFRLCAL